MVTAVVEGTGSTRRTSTDPPIAFDAEGQGDAVVFVHGIGGNRSNWRDQCNALSDRYQTLALDLRGYGGSGGIAGDLAFGDFVDDVVAVLDAVGQQRAHLVGHSMGGLVVQAFHAAHPQRVRSLTLVSCRPGDLPNEPGDASAARRLEALRQPDAGKALADAVLPRLLGSRTSPAARARMFASVAGVRLADYAKVVAVRASLQPVLNLSAVAVPTLVIGGAEDPMAPVAQMTAIARSIPGSELHILEGCGHFPLVEDASSFNAILDRFLSRLPCG